MITPVELFRAAVAVLAVLFVFYSFVNVGRALLPVRNARICAPAAFIRASASCR